jgi:hypothetical protein
MQEVGPYPSAFNRSMDLPKPESVEVAAVRRGIALRQPGLFVTRCCTCGLTAIRGVARPRRDADREWPGP